LALTRMVSSATPSHPPCPLSSTPNQRRVVVIGGGFAGTTLTRLLLRSPTRFHVTLIDTKDHFEFTPAAIQSLTDLTGLEGHRAPHVSLFRDTNSVLVVGRVNEVYRDHVRVGDARIPFDYLTIASGCSASSQFGDQCVTTSYRHKQIKLQHRSLIRATRVLVVGGGVLGCEVATQIAHAYPEKSVTLVHARPRLIHRHAEAVHTRMLRRLHELGVSVVLNDRVMDVAPKSPDADGDVYICSSGRRIHCEHTFIATRPWPLSGFVTPNAINPLNGRIRVRPTLQLAEHDHIFAAGDVSEVIEEKTAYAACCAANAVAVNITRIEMGKAPIDQGHSGTRGGSTKQSYPDLPTDELDAIRSSRGCRALIISLGGRQAMLVAGSRACVGEKWWWIKEKIEQRFLKVASGKAKPLPRLYGKVPPKLQAIDDGVRDPEQKHVAGEENGLATCVSETQTFEWMEDVAVKLLQHRH